MNRIQFFMVYVMQTPITYRVFCDPSAYIEVYGFRDASSKAIAAAVYIRVIKADQAKSSLLVAKTKLAPVKINFQRYI